MLVVGSGLMGVRCDRVCTLADHCLWSFTVAFSPDGTRLVSGGYDTLVKIWDVATGAVVRRVVGVS